MSNSGRSRRKLTQQTVIRVRINLVQHARSSNTASINNDKTLWSGQSLATEYTWRSRSWRGHLAADPHTGEQYSRIGGTNAQKQRSNTVVSTKTRFTNLNIPILWKTREIIIRTWSSKVRWQANFKPRMSRLGLAQTEGNPDKTKSTRGGLTVLDLLTTKAVVLLGFSIIIHQWLHHSWILAKALLRKAATAGLSAGLQTTASR